MKQLPDRVKTFPLPDTHLNGAAVLVCSLSEAQELVEQLRDLYRVQGQLMEAQLQVLKAFGDLYLELTDRSAERQFLQKSLLRAEREASRLRLPAWFWRIDKDAEIKPQLKHRAAVMLESSVGIDDMWDCLCDVLRYAGLEPEDSLIRSAIKGANDARTG